MAPFFSKVVGLAPFAIDDLAAALAYRKGETPFVTSIGVAMFKAVLLPRSLPAARGGASSTKAALGPSFLDAN
jgi:hypothetical protein